MRRQQLPARPSADVIACLFKAEAPALPLALSVSPPGLTLDADTDLLAKVLINLLHIAAQALQGHASPQLTLRLYRLRKPP